MDEARREEVMRQALVQRSALWAYCLGLCRDPQRAEDLFQDAHVVICRKWEQLGPDTPFLAWAFTIVRLTYLGGLDDRHRRLVLTEAEVLAETVAEAVEERRGNDAERIAALRHCLGQVTARTRSVLELRYLEGRSCELIATRVVLPVDAVYQILSRGRKALQDCIIRQLVSP